MLTHKILLVKIVCNIVTSNPGKNMFVTRGTFRMDSDQWILNLQLVSRRKCYISQLHCCWFATFFSFCLGLVLLLVALSQCFSKKPQNWPSDKKDLCRYDKPSQVNLIQSKFTFLWLFLDEFCWPTMFDSYERKKILHLLGRSSCHSFKFGGSF